MRASNIAGAVAMVAGAALITAAVVTGVGALQRMHWPESPPDMSAWNTCWKFTPQPDITYGELKIILDKTGGGNGLSRLGVKQDDPTFALVKRHFTQFDCSGGK